VTIALRSNQQAVSDTLTMPTHSTGDLLLAVAANDGASTAPTLPTGWINVASVGNNNIGATIGYKYAQSNSETFGTWTNADHVSVTCWYGSSNTIVWPWFLSTNGATSTNMQWLLQPANTFRTNSEDNALFAFGHNRSSTNNLAQTLGALTNLFEQGDGTNYQVCVKYQLGRTTAFATTTLTMAASVAWRTYLICLTEQTGYGFTGGSSGGLILPSGFNGGFN
jgi:hypothetical protein